MILVLPALLAVVARPASGLQTLTGTAVQAQVDLARGQEVLSVKAEGVWQPVLSAESAVHVRVGKDIHKCAISRVQLLDSGLQLSGDCAVGSFQQNVSLTSEKDVLDVVTRFTVNKNVTVNSVEDRYDFLPEKHAHTDEYTGPLDFVWSQNIKSEPDDLISINSFKSPALMMQQGRLFAAIIPSVNTHHGEVRALDLDVTSAHHPWMSYGAIPSQPHDHSYFRRSSDTAVIPIANVIEYRYAIVLSDQPPKLGYRRVVRRLWLQLGHPALLDSADEQQNVLRPELASFASWREDAWHDYADRIYVSFPCGQKQCGTLKSNRNVLGDWEHPEPDAWFNAWFQTLRSAYGWYMYGRAAHDVSIMHKAESILNLALASPRKSGAFSTIYLVDRAQWVPGDGWANYADSYQAFSMSWTAYWMVRWAEDLTPNRKAEILRFVQPYGNFLLAHQKPSGVIPSWYNSANLEPRAEFRDFNAETSASALFLATLGMSTGDQRYIAAAERAMQFIHREVLPRQRWFDFETYLSCARKDYAFYDGWTAQYPQNNLAEIQAPAAMLALYRATHKPEYLELGSEMLDYLLLTQQVWNNPLFTLKLLGGFTTQNTDQEWSDARQGYASTVLADYYDATGAFEYLERAIAAARSTFAVAPWENWAHTGFLDQPGALTGFHWGTGSAMTSVEMLTPRLRDALIDVKNKAGAGFDECTVEDVEVRGTAISFRIDSPLKGRTFHVRFRGVDPALTYQLSWNGGQPQLFQGEQLIENGVEVAQVEEQ